METVHMVVQIPFAKFAKKALQKLGFEIPGAEHTNPSGVEIYRQFWKEGKIFSSYPMEGIVLTVNSRKLQKQFGSPKQRYIQREREREKQSFLAAWQQNQTSRHVV